MVITIDNLSVTAKLITIKTAQDTTLARLVTCIHHGSWLIPYHHQRLELTVQDGCIIWGKCVIIPYVLRAKLLEEPHVGYIRICRMKALARSNFWWPHLDKDVEALVEQCDACKITAAIPLQAPSMAISKHTMGVWNKKDFLVMVDAFSKWPEVKVVSSTTTQKIVTVLSEIFAKHDSREC